MATSWVATTTIRLGMGKGERRTFEPGDVVSGEGCTKEVLQGLFAAGSIEKRDNPSTSDDNNKKDESDNTSDTANNDN